MGENFHRQVSHRWAKAETPSYGDDWGENDSDMEESPSDPEGNLEVSRSKDPENSPPSVGLHVSNPSTHTEPDTAPPKLAQAVPPLKPTAPNLVLSIDTLVREKSDEDSDESSDDGISDKKYTQITQEGTAPTPQVLLRNVEAPPRAPFSPALDTPLSDRSFVSDAESIQMEPESLRLFNHTHAATLDRKSESPKVLKQTTEYPAIISLENPVLATSGDEIPYDLSSLASDGQKLEENVLSPSRPNIPPLVISIDKKSTERDADDSSIVPDTSLSMGENTKEYAKDSGHRKGAVDDSDDDWGSDSEDGLIAQNPDTRSPCENRIDSIDTQLRNHTLADAAPKPSPPQFPEIGRRLYDDGDLSEDLETNSISDQDKAKSCLPFDPSSQEYLPLKITKTAGDKAPTEQRKTTVNSKVGHSNSVRKPPISRADLGSVDYSSIADAMDGYLDGQASIQNLSRDADSSDRDLKTPENETLSGDSEDQFAGFAKPIVPGQVNRRASVQSAKTFTLGNWAPNTSQFRNQFICEDDMESKFSFTPEDENISDPRTDFVRRVANRDMDSRRSSISIADTTDGDYPNSKTATAGSGDVVVPIGSTSTEADSVLQQHPHHTPLFQEERSTPNPSAEKLPHDLTRKYSSLIPPLKSGHEASNSKETHTGEVHPIKSIPEERAVSGEGVARAQTSQKYPVYDWKKIQAVSQPIDRIRMLKEALIAEQEYDTGLGSWLHATLKPSEDGPSIHIGKLALEAYQNATHHDIRRHVLIRSTVHNVKDKVETGGLQATSLGKRFFNRGRKLMTGSSAE